MIQRAHDRLLRILHIDPEPSWGGGEAQVFGLLRCLSDRGHQNELAAHPRGPLYAKCLELDIRCHPIVVRNDLDLRSVPMLRRLIRASSFDIVHFHTKRAHALSVWLPPKLDRPVYLVTRRMDYPERRSWRTRFLYNDRVDGIVSISHAIAELLAAAGVDRNKIRVIPSGVDAGRFAVTNGRRACGEDAKVVGCVGVLEQRKGHRFLLEAAALLKAQGLNLRYRIAGAGSLRPQLQQYAVRLGLENDVRFLDFVNDMTAFLADIDLFVMPSLFEGLGVAALEAMAAGKPVIATRVGGLVEAVRDEVTGLLVAPGDAAALAQAITRLVQDRVLAASMAVQGRARVEQQFSLEQMASQNESYYYELLHHVTARGSVLQ